MANLTLEEPALTTATHPSGETSTGGRAPRLMSGDDIGASIDIDGPPRDPPRDVAREVSAGEAHIHDVDQLAERSLLGGLVEHQVEVLQSGGRAGLERSRRDGVDAHAG